MPVTDFRQRTAVLFIAVVLGHIILISAQVNSRAGVPLLEVVTFGAFAEVQRGAAGLTGSIRDAWSGYGNLRGVREENDELKRQLGALQVQFQQERARAERARQLERLLGFQQDLQVETTPASVIGASASLEFRGITIDRGLNTGVTANMAVIAPTGLVGRIVTPTAHASKVQLLIDRNAAAGALVERTRAQGIVIGSGADMLRMDFVAATSDVKVGDTIVTSGVDGIYPKGFVIGKVEQVDNGNGIYKSIRVRPSVEFNTLEDVLVVKTPVARVAHGEGHS
ncbi:MAG TPA: rod shape-determining protein MreC [Vicinamibacterales bacterium]